MPTINNGNAICYHYKFLNDHNILLPPPLMENMEATKDLLMLFHTHWFEQQIFSNKPTSANPLSQNRKNIQDKSNLSLSPSLGIRSQSERCLSCKTSFSPKLQTVISGKELSKLCNFPEKRKEIKRMYKGGSGSRSLSELEFEELKGFMDLGFIFSEQDKNSRLVSIIPGLQRLGRHSLNNEHEHEDCRVSRPYLSEVWGGFDQRKVSNQTSDWRNMSNLPDNTDMKDHLKVWAHYVASSVK